MGANIIGNLSASNEIVSKSDYRRNLVASQSGRCLASYVYSSSGVYESSTDLVFSGHLLIGENGSILKENKRFQRENEVITSIIDIDKINSERLKNVSFTDNSMNMNLELEEITFQFAINDVGDFDRPIDRYPFVPSNEEKRAVRCKEIFNIQTSALAKRLNHTNMKKQL